MAIQTEISKIKTVANQLEVEISKCNWDAINKMAMVTKVDNPIPIIEQIQKFTTDIKNFNFSFAANDSLHKFLNNLEGILDHIKALNAEGEAANDISRQFNQGNVANRCQRIPETFEIAVERYLKFAENAKYLDQESIPSIIATSKEVIKKATEEHVKLIDGLNKTAVQNAAAIKYSGIFQNEANKFKSSANWWLGFTIVLLVIIVGVAIVFLAYFKDITGDSEIIQFTVTKVLIAAALFYGLNMCLKSYRAQKHNQIVNEHRHNALETFDVFQKSSNDEQTKSAVLLEVTRTIFGNQATGYSTPNDSEGDNASKIIEIIKQGK